jgi:hypothetical protein
MERCGSAFAAVHSHLSVFFKSLFVPTVYASIKRSERVSCEYRPVTAAKTKSWMFELSSRRELSGQVNHSYPGDQISLCGQDGIG